MGRDLASTLIWQFRFSGSCGSFMSHSDLMIGRILTYVYNRRAIRKLRELSATSPENAKTLRELGITRNELAFGLSVLQTKGKVKEIFDTKGKKRYYLL
jgi:hypothetical protein